MTTSVFHIGEQQVQARAGVRETMEPWGKKVVRTYLPAQHRAFYPELPFVVAAARDRHDRPWVTLLVGPRGFISSPDEHSLVFATKPLPGDALEDSLTLGTEFGLLGIELETRRRNRVNGTITATGATGMHFDVGQTFGNCPQYITERSWYPVEVEETSTAASRHRRLDAAMQAWIASADTLFIASGFRGQEGSDGAGRAFGMDASHRGGAPGFVTVESDTRLVFPDYAGNNHFNTIGNLVMDPGVGLVFVDFENGSILQITGKATVDFDSDEIAAHAGAQRLVVIDIDEIVCLDGVLPLRWSAPEGTVRELRVAAKSQETEDVVSLELIARDDGPLPDFEAGQHLPIEIDVPGTRGPVKRTYSLSNGPAEGRYRISVKRAPKGLVSNLIHDVIEKGSIISSRAPAGEFTLDYSTRSVVLISAGIGVTPMASMLHQLVSDGSDRSVTFIHGARDGAHHALSDEVRALAEANDNVTLDVAYSQPRASDIEGRDYDHQGRVTGAAIQHVVSDLDADFYVCGPLKFMSDIAESLEALGVAADRIHTETFGPAA